MAPESPWPQSRARCKHPCAMGGDVGQQCKESNAAFSWVHQEGWDLSVQGKGRMQRGCWDLALHKGSGKAGAGGLYGLKGGSALGAARCTLTLHPAVAARCPPRCSTILHWGTVTVWHRCCHLFLSPSCPSCSTI